MLPWMSGKAPIAWQAFRSRMQINAPNCPLANTIALRPEISPIVIHIVRVGVTCVTI